MQRKQRITSFEILRILAMLMIVIGHANQWGYFYREPAVFSTANITNSLAFILFSVFAGNTGVNCFVLISSWFLASNDKLKFDRILKHWIQIEFYSFFIALIFACIGKINYKETLHYITPVYSDIYWFMTIYVGFLLIAPFLTKFLNCLEKKDFRVLFICLSLLCLSIYKDIPYGNIFIENAAHSIMLWCSLFAVAFYLRKFGTPKIVDENKGKLLLGLVALQWIGGILINVLLKTPTIAGCFSCSCNGLTFFTSILLFLIIKDMKWRDRSVIRFLVRIAPYTLGVYMIHEHRLLGLGYGEMCTTCQPHSIHGGTFPT